jgi:hypothetical protein
MCCLPYVLPASTAIVPQWWIATVALLVAIVVALVVGVIAALVGEP